MEPATAPELAALLVRCPAAEPAVAAQRSRLDRAAAFGVPAHVTICFPFKPAAQLTVGDQEMLANAFAKVPSFVFRGERTGWFGEEVLYVAPTPAEPVVELTRLVFALFPEYPPYGGEFEDLVPHLTVGSGGREELRAAERLVGAVLPFEQQVAEVELWAGPPLDGPVGAGWRRVRSYPLG